MEKAELEDVIHKCAIEDDWNQVLKLYDKLYPDEIVEQEEGWSLDLTLTQKAGYLSEVGKNDEAIKIYNTLLLRKSSQPGESRGELNLKQCIGGALFCQNKFDEALELLNEVLEKQIKLLGDGKDPSKPDPHETKTIIADCLDRQGKFQEALTVYEQAYEAYVEFYGAEVDITAVQEFNIKSLQLKLAAANKELDLETILEIVGYGPTVLSIKEYGDDGKDTVLHRAVQTYNVNVIKIVFDEIVSKCEGNTEKLNEFLNFENSKFQTPLTLAVQSDCEDAVRFLLENGVPHGLEVNKLQYKQNALLLANYRRNEPIQKLLLEYNAVLPPE